MTQQLQLPWMMESDALETTIGMENCHGWDCELKQYKKKSISNCR
jgi:hypothetical protein